MPKPAYPVAGEVVGTAWATALSDFIGEKWKYVSVGWAAVLNGADVPVINTVYDLEIPQLPANDLSIVAAKLAPRITDTQGATLALNLMHTGGTIAGFAFTTGVAAAKGGEAGSCTVKVGGVNLRSVKWKVTGTAGANGIGTAKVTVRVAGYWVAEAGAIALGDPIDIFDPSSPLPGVEDAEA